MFPYIGGKAHHVKWMDPLFPNEFDTFVEVFGGAGWVSVKSTKVEQASTRIYNDYNPLLANVFECLRTNTAGVLELMNNTPKSDLVLYKQYQQELFGDLDWANVSLGNIELAVKYLYLQTQVFAGTPLSTTNVAYFTETKANGKYPSKYDTFKKKLVNETLVTRLHNITKVENLDCEELIRQYDSPSTFFYVDPPYYKMESYYSKDFPREKHKSLSETLNQIQGKFALSYYEYDDLHEFYPEDAFVWHRQNVYRSAATRSSTTKSKEEYNKKSKGTEILIMNYTPTPVVKDDKTKSSVSPINNLFQFA